MSWNNHTPPPPSLFLSVWVQFRLTQRSVSHLSVRSDAARWWACPVGRFVASELVTPAAGCPGHQGKVGHSLLSSNTGSSQTKSCTVLLCVPFVYIIHGGCRSHSRRIGWNQGPGIGAVSRQLNSSSSTDLVARHGWELLHRSCFRTGSVQNGCYSKSHLGLSNSLLHQWQLRRRWGVFTHNLHLRHFLTSPYVSLSTVLGLN